MGRPRAALLLALVVVVAASRARGQGCCACQGDIDGDGTVTGSDLGALLGAWGTAGTGGLRCEDVDMDGIVDGADLGLLLGAWQRCVAPNPSPCGEACTTAQDCCVGGAAPGCDDVACCAAVCAVDVHCCVAAWDNACTKSAAILCADCAPTACGTSTHDCVTAGAKGCNDVACCALVCSIDSSCCWTAWDADCVSLAATFCYGGGCKPACPGAFETELCGIESNPGCEGGPGGASTCCFASNGVDCDDQECFKAVCGRDPFCCMVAWDQICANEALALCPRLCDIGAASCCIAYYGGGCADKECEAVVCTLDATCCQSAWDWDCVDLAKALCPDICDGVDYLSDPIDCGQTVCGRLAYYSVGFGHGDDDAYRIPEAADGGNRLITVTLTGQVSSLSQSAAWVRLDRADCTDLMLSFVGVDTCSTASFEYCIGPDAYLLSVHGLAACAEPSTYSLSLECVPCVGDLTCCTAHEFTGCENDVCEALVCAVDVFCCTEGWDSSCVYWASGLCEPCGGFGPSADCCIQHPWPGCGDEACEEIVCAEDPFCCAHSWDYGCRDLAHLLCPLCGGGAPGSNCCVGTAGNCSDLTCVALVCAVDPSCCNGENWDYDCVAEAEFLCPVCEGWP